ncbi:RmlC-like jelly roll fold protein [Metarhizium guizhouense ARSEF 977]|uniref:Acireductone dioxygenase n=1 Tax=Metarhizium guizhouense (strain ARSEF 977) TaxID=1276136 RepID=A0A0B4H1X2_METGA|nr:RmlC-like jelly roll fold protein [Metarhizium guizhouense ARSEF 977]
MKAYMYDNQPGDQRLPHDSGRAISTEALGKLGVLYFHFANIADVDRLAADRGYKNRDEITVSPEKMGDMYEDKVKMFFNEHLHEDEEIRYIKGGQGFFDVRSKDDNWVRVRLEKDDLLILPAGIYHRFTTDEANIFGGTGHMGRSLVKYALSRGDLVTSVGRIHESNIDDIANIHHDNCLGALCDVRSRDSVAKVVQDALDRFRRFDVVANCSGHGVIGSCEDQDEHDLRNQFETNFIGTLHIIHTTLPYFRRQNSGRYLIFSSTSGALGVPGLGPYCATKYAVEGLIEAMLYETDSFNVRATLIEPGLVRRDEPDTSDSPLPTWGHFLIKPSSNGYGNATSPALHARRMVQWLGDRQPTSAVKCAELVWQLAHCTYPPLRLLLGSYAIESIRDRMRSVTEELEDWKHLNFATAGQESERDDKE